jgi:hypothetical protein
MSRVKKERLKKGRIFVPLIFSFGAVLEDLPLEEFLENTTKLSNTLRTIQNYFKVDGVVCYGDTTILAESLGCRLSKDRYPPEVKPLPEVPTQSDNLLAQMLRGTRVGTATEVTKRLNILLPDVILLCLVPGPLTLAAQLAGKDISEILGEGEFLSLASRASLNFVKALGDAGIDVVIVREAMLPSLDGDSAKVVGRCYTPLWNTAKFYGLSPLLMLDTFSVKDAEKARKFVDNVLLPAENAPEGLLKGKKLSFTVPVSLLEKENDEIEDYLKKTGVLGAVGTSKLFLLTTEEEIPQDINKELMIRGIKKIRDLLL